MPVVAQGPDKDVALVMKAEPVSLGATACANANLALIKYWGNADNDLRLPANGSISITLDGLQTKTSVCFMRNADSDVVVIDGAAASDSSAKRVVKQLDVVRRLAGSTLFAQVESTNSFPSSAGLASSASAFAALSMAATTALGLTLSSHELSALARLGSGSAARSIPGGFVEWRTGTTHEMSYAETIAPANHWSLVDVIAIVSEEPKRIPSADGHRIAPTSPLQDARVRSAPERLAACRTAIQHRDFQALAQVAALDSVIMHAVMMTSDPPLFYWEPATFAVMKSIRGWRRDGLEVFSSIDAGPHVHCVCPHESAASVQDLLAQHDGVRHVLTAPIGGPAHLC